MCENEWITAPSAIVTPGPITTKGSMVTSLPNLVSAERKTVSGAIRVTPASSAALRSRACITASASASCALVLMPRTSSSLVSITTASNPISLTMVDGIDQIILALAVGIADPVENFQRAAAVERHHAGIAQRHLALFFCRIGMLADRHQAVALEQQPAIAGRVGGAEAEHGKGCALRQRRAQPRKGLGRNQRRVAERHQQIVGAARDRRAGGQHRMGRAEALGLNEGRRIGAYALDLVSDRLVVRPDHDRQRSARSMRGGVQHMGQQRLAGDGVQHLRQRGPHARALTGRKHDSQAGSSGHSIPLIHSLADNADGAGPSLIVFPRR